MSKELVEAAQTGDFKKVQELLNLGADIDHLENEKTALYNASMNGHYNIVELLIMRGADINLGGFILGPPLSQCLSRTVKLLLRQKADSNKQGWHGNTPLHDAILLHQFESVKLLLEHSADPGIANKSGTTALRYARELGNTPVVKLIEDKMESDKAISHPK